MITVYDFMDLCVNEEQKFCLYDMTTDSVVWEGVKDDLPDEYEYLNVWSFDGIMPIYYGGKAPDTITLNIETSEE